jgi:hypothetical protein
MLVVWASYSVPSAGGATITFSNGNASSGTLTVTGNTAATASPVNTVSWDTSHSTGTVNAYAPSPGFTLSATNLYTPSASIGIGTTTYGGSILGSFSNGTAFTVSAGSLDAGYTVPSGANSTVTGSGPLARGRGILSGGAMSIFPFALFTGGTTLLVSVIACWVFFRFLKAFIAPKDKDGKSWWQRFKERWTKEYKLRKLRREVERSHLEASVHLESIDRDFPKKGQP